jgi:Ni,Fe-hydrogenase I cytochrome b subunit
VDPRVDRQNEHFGYERIASISYTFLYLTVACAVLTGLLLAGMRYDQGPFAAQLFDELGWHEFVLTLHNVSLYAATLFVFAHITGMIRHENKSGLPVAQSMLSGFQYRAVNQKRGDL